MEENSQVESDDTFAGFPPQVTEDVDGLMWLGYLEDNFEFCGHNFVIRTLRGDEELYAGLVCKEFSEAVGQDRALTWATIGLSLVSVDGDEDFCPPVGRDKHSFARGRFQYVSSKWFWPVCIEIYSHYVGLLSRQNDAIQSVEDLFSGSPLISTPFVDSSTDRADSEPATPEILDLLDDDSTPS